MTLTMNQIYEEILRDGGVTPSKKIKQTAQRFPEKIAMHNLGIPTTRSLAVVKTGEEVFRETTLNGAILTRVALSHIRVGTFQYIAARQKKK